MARVTHAHETTTAWNHEGETRSVWPGRNYPLGATWSSQATNFAVYAPAAEAVWVCLFDDAGTEERHQLTEHSLGVWHGALPGVAPGTRYGYRAHGPWDPDAGLRFNSAKLLLDPYGKAVSGDLTVDDAIFGYVVGDPETISDLDSAPYVPRSVVVYDEFQWGADTSPRRRWRDTVIYELHVKGMTALHDRVPEELRGTYAGLATPAVIDYLRDLGVTAVELLPVHQFFSEPALAGQRPGQLLGLQLARLLRPAQRLRRDRRPGPAGHRVQEDGQGLPRGGARGHPRRGLQPHRRGGPAGADAELPGPRRPRLLPARRAAAGRRDAGRAAARTPTGTSPGAATPSTPSTRRACG